MSSFIVSTQTMNNILNGLYGDIEFIRNYRIPVYKEVGLNEGDTNTFTDLGERLFSLNATATNEKYKSNSGVFEIPQYVFSFKSVNRFQFLKSLQCLIYQCSEGDTIHDPLYKWLIMVEKFLMQTIIDRIEQYKEAKWD